LFVLVFTVVVHAAPKMAFALVAKIELVMLFNKDKFKNANFQVSVVIPRSALTAGGCE
jgi:hypothetical protein